MGFPFAFDTELVLELLLCAHHKREGVPVIVSHVSYGIARQTEATLLEGKATQLS